MAQLVSRNSTSRVPIPITTYVAGPPSLGIHGARRTLDVNEFARQGRNA